jgi:hypothetical protein
MRKKQKPSPTEQAAEARKKTPTFLLEVPVRVTAAQAKRLRAHLEAARQFYNAVLSEGQQRLWHMRADPAWQTARAIPRTQKLERQRAFAALRARYGFSQYALHEAAKALNCSWIADHVDAVLAQTLATRAYRALNRLRLGPGPPGAGRVVEAEASPVSRTNGPIPGCASYSSRLSRAMTASCCGRTTGCQRSLTGRIRWWPTACATLSNMPA